MEIPQNKEKGDSLQPQGSVSPLERITVTVPDSSHPDFINQGGGDHLSISQPEDSPGKSPVDSGSSAFHSRENSEGHISLEASLGNSPALSPLAFDQPVVFNNHRLSLEFEKPPSSPVVVSKDGFKEPPVVVVEQPEAVVHEIDRGSGVSGNGRGGIGKGRSRSTLSILKRVERDEMLKKLALGLRIVGFVFSLISFSVMAADRYQGWALDSFNRYIEFRYCISVNVIGFVYAGAQAFDLSYNLAMGKFFMQNRLPLRLYLDFAIDQVIAYLLISASSSAAMRVEDWQLNWGKDKFADMATASLSMSFLAFVAVAGNALISGYAVGIFKAM